MENVCISQCQHNHTSSVIPCNVDSAFLNTNCDKSKLLMVVLLENIEQFYK